MNNEKAYEILLAGAIGDALGYKVEFDSLVQIENVYGKEGIKLKDLSNSLIVSDDTQMTMFCLDAVIPYVGKQQINLEQVNEDIYNCYIDWLYTQNRSMRNHTKTNLGQYVQLHKAQAPGNTCLNALTMSLETQKFGTLSYKINNSKGCGGIMRTAPVTFLDLNIEDTFKLGAMQAAITHGHPDGYLSSGFFAGLLLLLSQGEKIEEAIKQNMEILKTYPNSQDLVAYINHVVEHSKQEKILKGDELNELIGQGWVGDEALGVALYAFIKSQNLEQALDISTNHNGDSDSTASLAAQLYTAAYGLEEKYKLLASKLDISEPFEYIVNKYYASNKKSYKI